MPSASEMAFNEYLKLYDATDLNGIHFEVKRCERFLLWDAMTQADTDSGEDQMPIVAHRRNGKPWVAVMYVSDLIGLLKERQKLDELASME